MYYATFIFITIIAKLPVIIIILINPCTGLASSITGALSQMRHNQECSKQTAQEAGVDSGLGSQELSGQL